MPDSHIDFLCSKISAAEEVFWRNPEPSQNYASLTEHTVTDAEKRLERFAPLIMRMFPETSANNGLIESPLRAIPCMAESMSFKHPLFLKCDNQLPISGSVKARGGIYEVLKLSEKIALESDLFDPTKSYAQLSEPEFRNLFNHTLLAVGSTGNLGLSIGIIGAALGFRTVIHMSAEAQMWKKELLRQIGTQVIEYNGDYEKAVAAGRSACAAEPNSHFVDDENSADLFWGYATAGRRLANQLNSQCITINKQNPLHVYIPCGVGGAPGGISYGLKAIYQDTVKIYFAEPVQAPAMLLGLMSGKNEQISAADYGLSGRTIADGLAVQRPSSLACRLIGSFIDGCFTVQDEKMLSLLRCLWHTEKIFAELSACAGFAGLQNTPGTHVVWATGGNMMPHCERLKLLEVSNF